jgi:hypothetical protein
MHFEEAYSESISLGATQPFLQESSPSQLRPDTFLGEPQWIAANILRNDNFQEKMFGTSQCQHELSSSLVRLGDFLI